MASFYNREDLEGSFLLFEGLFLESDAFVVGVSGLGTMALFAIRSLRMLLNFDQGNATQFGRHHISFVRMG